MLLFRPRVDLVFATISALALGACGARSASSPAPPAAPERAPETPAQADLVARVDKIAAALADEMPLAGATVALARGGEIVAVHAVGMADLEQQVPASKDTVYCIGSISKTFAAAAVLQLVEAGQLRLDEDITRYLPDFPTHGHRISIHHLLHHESGIQDFEYKGSWPTTKAVARTKKEVVNTFRDLPLEFTPGAEWRYSTSGYYLLGLVIERVSGQPYETYMRERVFEPAGLTATTLCDAAALIPHRARGYTQSEDGKALRNAELADLAQFGLGGGICSTTTDLLRFWNALATGKIVTPASFERMSTPPALADGTPTDYGYGLFRAEYRGVLTIGHNGGVPGFSAQLLHYPDADITLAVLSNFGGAALDLEHRLAQALVEFEPIQELPVPAGVRERAVGCYRMSDGYSAAEIRVDGDALVLDARGGKGRPLRYQGEGRFLLADAPIQFSFEGPSGPASQMVVTMYGMRMPSLRVPCSR